MTNSEESDKRNKTVQKKKTIFSEGTNWYAITAFLGAFAYCSLESLISFELQVRIKQFDISRMDFLK